MLEHEDAGPWAVDVWGPENSPRVVIQSEDFTSDVALIVDGDFASLEDKMRYAEKLAARLNVDLKLISQSLRTAVTQNDHDMLMTGEELRECRQALEILEKLHM